MNIVFVRKLRNTRSTWEYISDQGKGTVEAPDDSLLIQMGTVIDAVVKLNGENITVISPQMGADFLDNMVILFPNTLFLTVNESSIHALFDRAFTNDVRRRRVNQNILFAGCDASGGHTIKKQGSKVIQSAVSAAWCWATDGPNGSYGFGNSGMVNVNVAEYEGIMNCIVANRDAEAARIHIYSDSANAVDMFNYDLTQGIIPREARKYGLESISREVMEIINDRKVTVQWVKGHRAHRLNMIADAISRHARKKYMSGFRDESFIQETDAMYAVFNRNS